MASRANVPVFHLANSSSQSSSQPQATPQVRACSPTDSTGAPESGSNSASPSMANDPSQSQTNQALTHNHNLPRMSQPVSPSQGTRRNSMSSIAGADHRNRADSARETINPTNNSNLEHSRPQTGKRRLGPFAERAKDIEGAQSR